MLRKITIQIIIIFALIFPYELAKTNHCDICLVDECYANFETQPDGDGMTDDLEIQLPDLWYLHSWPETDLWPYVFDPQAICILKMHILDPVTSINRIAPRESYP